MSVAEKHVLDDEFSQEDISEISAALLNDVPVSKSALGRHEPSKVEATSQAGFAHRPNLSDAEQHALANYWKPFSDETPRLKNAEPVKADHFQAITRKALKFILENQNPDGSWGNATNTKRVNIYAPVPSAHHAYRGGSTALVVCGLCEWESIAPEDLRPAITEAIDKSQQWLFENMPKLKRSSADCTYNTWGHGYSLSAFVRLFQRAVASNQKDLQRQIVEQIKIQIERLGRYEYLNGGWAYYDFDNQMAKPAGSPSSFVTSMVLLSLHEVAEMRIPKDINEGRAIEIPQKLIDRAVASLIRQQKPDFSYLYGEYLNKTPNRGVNRPSGSLARSQSCNLALYHWTTLQTDEQRNTLASGGKVPQTALPVSRFVTQQIMTDYLDRFVARIGWLEMGRKHSIPHDAVNSIAGYFYYYGHFYASEVLVELKNPDDQKRLSRHIVNILQQAQDKDGSYWDFALYNYHQYYGTGMALVSLARCGNILGEEVQLGHSVPAVHAAVVNLPDQTEMARSNVKTLSIQ